MSVTATAFAALQAYRTHRSQSEVLDNVVRGYAGFATWSYQQHVRERLLLISREGLGAVNHGEQEHPTPPVPQAADLAHYLPWNPDCFCHQTETGPLPALLAGFTLGSDTTGMGENLLADPDRGWIVSHSESVEHFNTIQAPHQAHGGRYDWINDTLTALVRYGPSPTTGFGWIVDHGDGGDRILSYTVMPTAWGDTLIYAAVYSPEAFTTILERIFERDELLPGVDSSGAVMAVEVRDAQGDRLYASRPDIDWRLDQTRRLRGGFGDLTVRAQILPERRADARDRRAAALAAALPGGAAVAVRGAVAGRGRAAAARGAELGGCARDFVASVSHELRTPLAQMRLFLETLRLGRVAHRGAARVVARQHRPRGARLTHLVENVLRFSRSGGAPTHG